MTWSIVARDPATGQIGIAVATCAFAVGGRVPYVRTGVGAVASQAFVNPFYGPRGLDLLAGGASAVETVAALVGSDTGRGDRQVHVLDGAGRLAAHTGADCVPWCGHILREEFSVAGNMLAGPAVIEDTAATFAATAGEPLHARLLAGLVAGEKAGGDKRGRQSAAILTHDGEDYPLVDIRVDDHADPLAELGRLLAIWSGRPSHYRRAMPSRARPDGIVGRAAIERFIAESSSGPAVASRDPTSSG